MATLAVIYAPGAAAGVVAAGAVAGAGGDVFPNNGKTIVEITNGSGSPITPTFASTGVLPSGAALVGGGSAIAAGTTRIFGPFPTEFFNNSSGQVAITYTDVTLVGVRVISLIPG